MPVNGPVQSGLAITVTVPQHVIATSGTLHINIVQKDPPKRPPAVPPRNNTRYEIPLTSHQRPAYATSASQSPPCTTPPPTPVYGQSTYIEMLPKRPQLPLPRNAVPSVIVSPPLSPGSPCNPTYFTPTPECPAAESPVGGSSSGEPIYYECCTSGADRNGPPAVPPRSGPNRPNSAQLREKSFPGSSSDVVETARSLSQGDDPRNPPGKPSAAGTVVFRRMTSFMKNKK